MNSDLSPTGSLPDSEEWFIEHLEHPAIDVAGLCESLEGLAGRAAVSQADSQAKLLQDVLLERGEIHEALRVLRLRASWMDAGKDAEAAIRDELLSMSGPDTERRTLVEHAGFGRVQPAEAVRRMGTLIRLREGTPCFDKTWGFGVVRRIDTFEKRYEIDFETKQGHRMTFAYAGETLQVLDETHLLTRLHRDPEAIRTLVRERPGEIVRLAIQSFGPMVVVQLQTRLSPRIVPEAGWKAFWDSARKGLKKDGTVEIPAKRTEPLRLREVRDAGDREWIKEMDADRDMTSILSRVAAAIEEGRVPPDDAGARTAVANRLEFVLKGARGRNHGLVVRAVLAADRLGLEESAVAVQALLDGWRSPAAFVASVHDLPARDVRPFIEMALRRAGPEFAGTLIDALDHLKAPVLSEVLDILLSSGREADCAERIRGLVGSRRADVEVLLWLHRNPARWTAWDLGRWFDFARIAVAAMEKDHCGDRLKAQNALRERFAKVEWLQELFGSMDDDGRREMFLRIKETSAWPSLERQGILGRVVKLHPELEDLLRGGSQAPVQKLPLTSVRSYLERHAQWRKIVEVDIPQNSKDIGVARSYGDLRENFEYKAAKETQSILLHRQGELEAALKQVQQTEFDGPASDRVGPGVGVDLDYADGSRERYYILGVWDRDEALGIISSDTRMAQAIEGHAAGDEVTVPCADGERQARVASVVPLPDDICRWVRGDA